MKEEEERGYILTRASGKTNIGYVLGLSVIFIISLWPKESIIRRVSGDNHMNFPKLVGRQESKVQWR